MADISKIDKAAWQKFKKNADIKSSSWFKRADADVGKHIDAFQKARREWKAVKGEGGTAKAVESYLSAMIKLNKALQDFLKAKEFKTEVAKNLQGDIVKWRNELDGKAKKFLAFYKKNEKALKQTDADKMRDALSGMGL